MCCIFYFMLISTPPKYSEIVEKVSDFLKKWQAILKCTQKWRKGIITKTK